MTTTETIKTVPLAAGQIRARVVIIKMMVSRMSSHDKRDAIARKEIEDCADQIAEWANEIETNYDHNGNSTNEKGNEMLPGSLGPIDDEASGVRRKLTYANQALGANGPPLGSVFGGQPIQKPSILLRFDELEKQQAVLSEHVSELEARLYSVLVDRNPQEKPDPRDVPIPTRDSNKLETRLAYVQDNCREASLRLRNLLDRLQV